MIFPVFAITTLTATYVLMLSSVTLWMVGSDYKIHPRIHSEKKDKVHN